MSTRRTSSSEELRFNWGDRVLLTYIRGSRTVVVPVVFGAVTLDIANYDPETMKVPAITGFTVFSGRGGKLHVRLGSLRPDTVLDRIVGALEEADELRRSSS